MPIILCFIYYTFILLNIILCRVQCQDFAAMQAVVSNYCQASDILMFLPLAYYLKTSRERLETP